MKKILVAIVTVMALFSLTACQSLDVVGKTAISSFEKVTQSLDSSISIDEMNNGWSIISPGGERFVWSRDFSSQGKPDLMMELDAAPFISAGLDTTKLDNKMYFYDSMANKLMIHSELGNEKLTFDNKTKPMDTFREIVNNHRDSVNYHEKLDHYGFLFGNGNVFEWAKDVSTNDKDMVFVLNPTPLIDAGVNPEKVDGWVFAKVEIKNDKGKTELIDKLLKAYNLK